ARAVEVSVAAGELRTIDVPDAVRGNLEHEPRLNTPPPTPAAMRPVGTRTGLQRRTKLVVALSAVGAAVVVGLAVGLGVGLSSRNEPYTPSTAGDPIRSTP